jgi:UDPglucose 6-dehydrogenase
MKLTVYGAGYVGLVTGVCFAELGHDVVVVEINQDRIEMLQKGIPPFYETGLDFLLQRNLKANRVRFTRDLKEGVAHGIFQFIAVGTPPAKDGSADLQYVLAVAEGIAQQMTDYKIIVNKSTVSIGTARRVSDLIAENLKNRNVSLEYDVVSNPEFLKQGAAVEDFMNPDRIIVGTDSSRPLEKIKHLYAKLSDNHQRLMVMDTVSAEFTKYSANAYLATRISFINEMSQLAERFGADIDMVRRGMGSDHRIGHHFLHPGCGFGGSCFPKDVSALKNMAVSKGYSPNLLNAVETVNQQQKLMIFNKVSHYFSNNLTNKTAALWGLSFKPNTDDMREATSLILLNVFMEAGMNIKVYDPVAMNNAKKIIGDSSRLIYCDERDDTLQNADMLVIVTEWDEFRNPDFELIKKRLSHPVIFDGRNLYDPETMRTAGIKYFAVGRGDSCN